MSNSIKFLPRITLDAKENLRVFILGLQPSERPFGFEHNRFDDDAWSIVGLSQKGSSHRFIYFAKLGFNAASQRNRSRNGAAAEIPLDQLMAEPFRSFAKCLINYLHFSEKTTALPVRLISLRYIEAALIEMKGCACPTAITPEVMNRAVTMAAQRLGRFAAYNVGQQLTVIYRATALLKIFACPSEWTSPLPSPQRSRNRVGSQFERDRQEKLPSPLALEALAEIFNSDTDDPTAVFSSSLCALMLCSPDRAVEALYAPLDLLIPDWIDPSTGELGTGLRWYPAKGVAPMVKTVIPIMRTVAERAVEKMRRLTDPARRLAIWYENNPDKLFLSKELEHLRMKTYLNLHEVHAILFGGSDIKATKIQRGRATNWLDVNNVKRHVAPNKITQVVFAELEQAILAALPPGFPIMDPETNMRYSEALCIARVSEFRGGATSGPSHACFDRINYEVLKKALKSSGLNKSIFEKLGYRDSNGSFLSITTHMLRHYLNTLVRNSGKLTEEEIAKWSGRKCVRQNSVYNHESNRDILAKLRAAVGDPNQSIGPFSNINNRVFVRREEFASIKIITAHTSEFGYCIHDYAQAPCQVHQDCINCDEQVCIKGDQRAEANLRKMQSELSLLQENAKMAFDANELGAAAWFKHQTQTLNRVNELVALLADPNVPKGAVIQLDVEPPSRLSMAEDEHLLPSNFD
ncbi:hypothetical protein [Massilia oculi]|uniref:hypothetical protein n=1 Tax=Massilia oculi TaxID=945844 RepID=UPI001AAFA1B6|nr:hypothetical protein [Massilia oculi]